MHAGDDGLRRPQPETRDHEAEEEPFHALKILARLASRPAGHEPGRHSGAYLHAQLRVEQDRTDEGIAHSRRADPGERSQVHRPAIDQRLLRGAVPGDGEDRKSTRLNSSHVRISYAVFCLKKKNKQEFIYFLQIKYNNTNI